MTFPVTVYRWDDPGAPQITTTYGTPNEIKNVLEKCLVDGYGNKNSLGWTKVFDTSQGVVFQNNISLGGSGGMVRFWPRNTGNWDLPLNASTQLMNVQAARTYMSVDTSYLPGQMTSFYHPETRAIPKAWILIGTAIGFYLFLNRHNQSGTDISDTMCIFTSVCSFYVGDIISTIPNDSYTFVCLNYYRSSSGQNPTEGVSIFDNLAYVNSTNPSLSANPTNGFLMYAANGGSSFALYSIQRPFSYTDDLGFSAAGQNNLTYSSSVYLQWQSAGGMNNTITNVLPWIRGLVPGLLNTIYGDGGKITKWPYTRQIEGVNHLLFQSFSPSQNMLSHTWLNMVEW